MLQATDGKEQEKMRHHVQIYSIRISAPSAAFTIIIDRAIKMIRTWHERMHQRRQLQQLNDRDLRDIGISRLDAQAEWRKPFWRE